MRSLLVLLVACAACTSSPRQTAVRFSADPSLPLEGAQVRILFWGHDQRTSDDPEILGPAPFEDDLHLVVNAGGADVSRRFTVFAELLAPSGARLSWVRARGEFLADEALGEIRLRFEAGCRAPMDRPEQNDDFDPYNVCGSHDTCGAREGTTECQPACVDVTPYVEGDAPPSPTHACEGQDCARVTGIEASYHGTCALADGDAFCWGAGGSSVNLYEYYQPSLLFDEGERARRSGDIVDVHITHRSVCVVHRDGRVRCGGRAALGALGIPASDETIPIASAVPDVPPLDGLVGNGGWIGGLTEGGEFWHAGVHPILGGSQEGIFRRFEPQIDGLESLVGGRHFFAGFIGEELSFNGGPDVVVPALTRASAERIFGSQFTFCAIDANAGLRCWGYRTDRSDSGESYGPDGEWKHMALDDTEYSSTGGGWHHCAVKTDGSLWCWGRAEHGMLGSDVSGHVAMEDRLRVGERSDWVASAVGLDHTCALDESGTVWCFGANNYGQLARRGGGNDSEPARICVPSW